MKKYLLYASVLCLAAYGGNHYNAAPPKTHQAFSTPASAAPAAAKSNDKPILTDTLMELPGIKPAAVFLIE